MRVEVHVHIPQLEALLGLGSHIMAKLDELKAALAGIAEGVDAVDTKLDGVREGIAGVSAEVQTLIGMVSNGQNPDLTDVLTQAQTIQSRVNAVQAEVDQAGDALKAIPPVPAP